MPLCCCNKRNTTEIKAEKCQHLFNFKHEDADTRLVFHVILASRDIIVVSKDTDILILLIWTYAKCEIRHKWLIKYGSEKYAGIKTFCGFPKQGLSLVLPSFHALTECDTISYLVRVGSVRSFNKLLEEAPTFTLLTVPEKEEPLNENNNEDLKKFVRSIMYNGKKDESHFILEFAYISSKKKDFTKLTSRSRSAYPSVKTSTITNTGMVSL